MILVFTKRKGATREKQTDALLYLDGVDKTFDGFKALNNLSFVLKPGEMRAIIGPNGAGKTTMMDVITGKTKPDTGDIIYQGRYDLTQFDETDVARMGIGRKFQKPSVFESQSVFDNLELAIKDDRDVFSTLFASLNGEQKDRIDEVLEITRLVDKIGANASDLSHGQKQWLEIGMLLVQDPELLFLDEPVAGMTDAETDTTADLLREVAGKHSIVVVEHDMNFIKALDVKVTVLHEGRVLAEGSIAHVQANEDVIDVYLGR